MSKYTHAKRGHICTDLMPSVHKMAIVHPCHTWKVAGTLPSSAPNIDWYTAAVAKAVSLFRFWPNHFAACYFKQGKGASRNQSNFLWGCKQVHFQNETHHTSLKKSIGLTHGPQMFNKLQSYNKSKFRNLKKKNKKQRKSNSCNNCNELSF